MNSMNDSGEFHEVESNQRGGRSSYVSSQLAMIQSSRSMLSHDKRLPLDAWNAPGLRENVFGNLFSTFGLPEILLKEFIMVSQMRHEERQNQFNRNRDFFRTR